MRILAIGAHPDDIEYGCAGALLKAKLKGWEVFMLVMSRGELGGDPLVRKKEQEDAATLLKVDGLFWAHFEDTRIPVDRECIDVIEEVIKKVEPDEIYVNWPEDFHQDHRAVALATLTASRYIKRVIFYEDYTSVNFQPDIFVDITSLLDRKIDILKCHRSQVERIYPTGFDMIEASKSLASFRGFQGKVKYAEGFKAFRYLKEF